MPPSSDFGRFWRLSSRDMIQPKYRGDGLCIADGAPQNHGKHNRKSQHAFDNDLVFFGRGFAGTQAGGQVDGHGFGDESWAGVKLQNPAPTRGAVTSLFDQFPFRSFELVFTGIDAAGGQFPQIIAGGMAVLSLEKHTWGGARIIDG